MGCHLKMAVSDGKLENLANLSTQSIHCHGMEYLIQQNSAAIRDHSNANNWVVIRGFGRPDNDRPLLRICDPCGCYSWRQKSQEGDPDAKVDYGLGRRGQNVFGSSKFWEKADR